MKSSDELFQSVQALLPRSVVRRDEPLGKRTTLRVGGCADVYVEPSCEEDLGRTVAWCHEGGVPLMVLGRGSNLLVRDGGVRGVVVCLAHPSFARIEAVGALLRCGAGAKLKAVAAAARERALGGLEFLEGIPGSVGGALRMNAGAMGSAIFEVITAVRCMNESGHAQDRGVEEIGFEYRSCPFFKTHIAVEATFRGQPDTKEAVVLRGQQLNQRRWESQPKEASAGCIFKNPSRKLPAGKLIEELGLKGARRGGASVSTVHGNFIINEGSATAADVLELIEFIKARAKAEQGIELSEEVEVIGE